MERARLEHRMIQCCPSCRSEDHTVYRKVDGSKNGHILNRCLCRNCGNNFEFEVNAMGKPVITR